MAQQFHGLYSVLGNPAARCEQDCKMIFADRISLRCSQLVPARRRNIIARHTEPLLVREAKAALGAGQPALRRKAKQADRLGGVRGNTEALLEEIAHENLAFCIPGVDIILAGLVRFGMLAAPFGASAAMKSADAGRGIARRSSSARKIRTGFAKFPSSMSWPFR